MTAIGNEDAQPRIAYTAKGAARALGVRPARLLTAIRDGELPARRLGTRNWLITREALLAWASLSAPSATRRTAAERSQEEGKFELPPYRPRRHRRRAPSDERTSP